MPTSPLERGRTTIEDAFGVGELFVRYLTWHYSQALIDTVIISLNFLWFILHFFSIPLHVRTLFSPWRRMKDQHHKGESVEDFFATLVFNFASRLVGMIARLVIIALGTALLLGAAVCALAWFALWLVFPTLSVVSLFVGITLIL
jgi:hypothetical protein